eukprot:CAMPEP_0185746658 /NCGR_PEP_ID=MMETSP1174-20130828/5273_1 /TAXON_ID=35687 /ORGANISM="Dictyocha speculum, Strain CCMP1381" /LENGTH=190 /DNA_ID=CAMNT_0028421489 /DNA_START=61 /DNA_END=629 /DNA_ORIENTATION=-
MKIPSSTSLQDAGCRTVQDLFRLSDAELRDLGLKKGSRVKIASWKRNAAVDFPELCDEARGVETPPPPPPLSPPFVDDVMPGEGLGEGTTTTTMTTMDPELERVLASLDLLGQYGPDFCAQGILTMSDLAFVTNDTLADVGLRKGPRLKIKKWQLEHFVASGVHTSTTIDKDSGGSRGASGGDDDEEPWG